MSESKTNGTKQAAAPTIDEIIQTSQAMMAEKRRIDAGMVAALNKVIADSGKPVEWWALKMGLGPMHLADVLEGRQEVNWYFWERIKATFEPMRAEAFKRDEVWARTKGETMTSRAPFVQGADANNPT